MTEPTNSAQALMDEVNRFHQKLAQGVATITNLDEVRCGVTPHEVVYQEDKLRLLHYKGVNPPTNPTPLLIVYALVNRPYMTDLQENRSTIKGLLETGQDVYLCDWGYPDALDRYLTLNDYLNGYLDRCVNVIRKRHQIEQINILGICQGGVFSLCYSAMHPEKVKNLVTMVTPVNFQTPDNVLSHWVQQVDIDQLVDTLGNVPGTMLNWTFLNLKPYQLMGQKYLGLVDSLDNTETLTNFLRMEKWILDSPDQAGETIRQFVKDFFQGNKLVQGGLKIGEQSVDLKTLTMPLLNVYATQDHLVPPAASLALKELVGTEDYEEFSFKGGHIGIYVSSKAQQTVPPKIGSWLNQRQ